MQPNITVWSAVYSILRAHNMTTIFGNPGSTEETMLMNFPPDFQYILGLQEASVVGMADGYAQATNNPVLTVLHSAAGVGNAMGNIITSSLNKSPLVIIAGQQERQMLVGDPYLTNRDPTNLINNAWIKWAYQPASAGEVPGALVRAIAMATLPPAGPVFLSIPLNDWYGTPDEAVPYRTVSTAVAPDPTRLKEFADRIAQAKRLVLVYGEEVDQSGGWDAGVALAELLQVKVLQAPLAARAVFPANNPLYNGSLPLAQGPIGEVLAPFDLVLVVGAEVFRYYPWQPGPVLQPGTKLLQITNSPHDAGAARIGDSLVSDARLALEGLYELLKDRNISTQHAPATASTMQPSSTSSRVSMPTSNANSSVMTAAEAFEIVAMLRKPSDILVTETPSNLGDLLYAWPVVQPESYFTSASGFLGWGLPAAVGVALAQTNRTVVAVIGDGSLQYSIQSIYTAVQKRAKVLFLVPRNEEYAILKEFAIFENTPGCPGLNIPGLNADLIAQGYGCTSYRVNTAAQLYEAMEEARRVNGPALIEFQISPKLNKLPV